MSNTATRLITLLMLLQRQPNQKAGELADELGCQHCVKLRRLGGGGRTQGTI